MKIKVSFSKFVVLGFALLAVIGTRCDGAVLIHKTFDGNDTNDTGPAFKKASNGLGGDAVVATGVISAGAATNHSNGFNNTSLVDITTAAPSATGFRVTYVVASTTVSVSSLVNAGMFFGVVAGTNATSSTATGLWQNDPLAFGYNPKGNAGTNIMRQDITGSLVGTNFGLGTAPTDASYQDGFTVVITVMNDNSWTVISTGLSEELNDSGTLDTARFNYSSLASGVGMYAGFQGDSSALLAITSMTLESVPEPSVALLGGLGVLVLLQRRR